MDGKKILLVGSNNTLMDVMLRNFGREGYAVYCLPKVEQAREFIENVTPDYIIREMSPEQLSIHEEEAEPHLPFARRIRELVHTRGHVRERVRKRLHEHEHMHYVAGLIAAIGLAGLLVAGVLIVGNTIIDHRISSNLVEVADEQIPLAHFRAPPEDPPSNNEIKYVVIG